MLISKSGRDIRTAMSQRADASSVDLLKKDA